MVDEVRYQVEGPRATLTLDRPAVKNALGAQTIAQILEHLRTAEADPAVRVVVFTGAGERVFCPGGDLSMLVPQDAPGGGPERQSGYAELLTAFSRLSKPSIARVNGHALAGGLGLLLACDLAVMADDAALGLPEIDRGLFPMMVTALLQRHLGRKRALQLLLTGARIDAATALAWGLVNQVVPRAELDAAVDALATGLAAKSPTAMRLGRRAFFHAEDLAQDQALTHLEHELAVTVASDDAAEGVAAFLEKRTPQWKGT